MKEEKAESEKKMKEDKAEERRRRRGGGGEGGEEEEERRKREPLPLQGPRLPDGVTCPILATALEEAICLVYEEHGTVRKFCRAEATASCSGLFPRHCK